MATRWDIDTYKTSSGFQWRAVKSRTGRWLTRNQAAAYAAQLNKADDKPGDSTLKQWTAIAWRLYAKM